MITALLLSIKQDKLEDDVFMCAPVRQAGRLRGRQTGRQADWQADSQAGWVLTAQTSCRRLCLRPAWFDSITAAGSMP